MEKGKAVGIVECNGLPTAIAFLDTALKSADVKLLGMELAKGEGMVDIKLIGNVGAVKAAMEAGTIVADMIGGIMGKIMIPRPHDNIQCMLKNTYVMHKLNQQENNGHDDQSILLGQTEKMAGTMVEVVACEGESMTLDDPDEMAKKQYTCNLCKDPKCTRIKGRPHAECIHDGEKDLEDE